MHRTLRRLPRWLRLRLELWLREWLRARLRMRCGNCCEPACGCGSSCNSCDCSHKCCLKHCGFCSGCGHLVDALCSVARAAAAAAKCIGANGTTIRRAARTRAIATATGSGRAADRLRPWQLPVRRRVRCTVRRPVRWSLHGRAQNNSTNFQGNAAYAQRGNDRPAAMRQWHASAVRQPAGQPIAAGADGRSARGSRSNRARCARRIGHSGRGRQVDQSALLGKPAVAPGRAP